MPDIVNDGMVKVVWVTTLSSTSSPTATQINAGVDLTPFITADGFEWTTSEATVDTSALNSVDDTAIPGRRADEIELTFKNQGDSAAPWTTFASNPDGWIVERRGVAYGTAIAASQKVRVFPVRAGFRNKLPVAANEVEKFSVKFHKTAAVVDSATVA